MERAYGRENKMSIPNHIIIAINEITIQIDHSKPAIEKIRESMILAKKHWIVTNHEEQFKAAIGAVLLSATPEEKQVIEAEMEDMNQFGSALHASSLGVPVDFISFLGQKDRSKFYGLMGIWKGIP